MLKKCGPCASMDRSWREHVAAGKNPNVIVDEDGIKRTAVRKTDD